MASVRTLTVEAFLVSFKEQKAGLLVEQTCIVVKGNFSEGKKGLHNDNNDNDEEDDQKHQV